MLDEIQNPHMPAFPQSNLHLDILMGRDESLDTPDFMGGTCIPTTFAMLRLIDYHRPTRRSVHGHPRRHGEEAPDGVVLTSPTCTIILAHSITFEKREMLCMMYHIIQKTWLV